MPREAAALLFCLARRAFVVPRPTLSSLTHPFDELPNLGSFEQYAAVITSSRHVPPSMLENRPALPQYLYDDEQARKRMSSDFGKKARRGDRRQRSREREEP